jgi:DNA-binding response OmpR family regulator
MMTCNEVSRTPAKLTARPAGQADLELFRFACGTVNLEALEICYHDGHRCPLSKREAALLRYLDSRGGAAASRDEILAEVWQMDPRRVRTRTLDMHVSKLRHKLRDNARAPSVLKTITGGGYLLSRSQRADIAREVRQS